MNQTNLVKHEHISSLTKSLKQSLTTIKEQKSIMKATQGIIFILDVSGSMAGSINGKMKITALREAMQDYPANRKIAFSQTIWENQIPEPQANTNLTSAFIYCQNIIPKPSTFVLVSDGEADNPETAMEAGLSLNVPINIIYIGYSGSEGEKFMKELAHRTGGQEHTINTKIHTIDVSNQLKSAVIGLLPEKSSHQ